MAKQTIQSRDIKVSEVIPSALCCRTLTNECMF